MEVKLMNNVIYFQSGGPTSVINTSLYGAIKAFQESDKIEKFYVKERRMQYCLDCGAPIDNGAVRCRQCANLNSRACERPTREELKELIRKEPFTSIGKLYGVSDNAVRKWCIKYGLPFRARDLKQYVRQT